MANSYVELRKKPTNGNGLTTDLMRHLHTRQHLGKVVIICDQPSVMLSAARKQWLRLSRYVQKQRAATLDAEKILKYTHTVTHMQNMRFSAKAPLGEPTADAYFISPDAVEALPAHCLTVYITTGLNETAAAQVIKQLSPEALIVDYIQTCDWDRLDVHPKSQLEKAVLEQWHELEYFLTSYHIRPESLFNGQLQNVDALDEALDILLGASRKFLRFGSDFQHALELARPLKLSKKIREQYDAVSILAHRVQALTPGAFTQQFLETYSEDDTFFLHDRLRGLLATETLTQAVQRHLAAGRVRLAEALRQHSFAKQ